MPRISILYLHTKRSTMLLTPKRRPASSLSGTRLTPAPTTSCASPGSLPNAAWKASSRNTNLFANGRTAKFVSVACLVGFAGRPAAVPEEEFAKIRSFLQQGLRAQPHPYLQTGRRVRVHSGPLRGVEGIVLRRKNGCRLVISLDLIQRSMAVDIDEADVGCLS